MYLSLALMLLAFTTRPMVRSAHLALSLLHSLILPFQGDNRTRKYILHSWVPRDGLISALVTKSSPRLKARACAEMSPSRLRKDVYAYNIIQYLEEEQTKCHFSVSSKSVGVGYSVAIAGVWCSG